MMVHHHPLALQWSCMKPARLLMWSKAPWWCSWGHWLLSSQGSRESSCSMLFGGTSTAVQQYPMGSLLSMGSSPWALQASDSLLYCRSLCQQRLRDSKSLSACCRRLLWLYPGDQLFTSLAAEVGKVACLLFFRAFSLSLSRGLQRLETRGQNPSLLAP